MSALYLIFSRRNPPEIDTLRVDASLSQSHDYTSQATEFPVEDGASISDHIYNLPAVYSMTGWVTNTPINIQDVVEGVKVQAETGRNRTETSYDKLIDIRNSRIPITIVTSLTTYDNMVMNSISFPRKPGQGETLEFQATFKEFRLVDSETITLPNLAKDTDGAKAGTDQQGTNKKKKGKANTKNVQTSTAFGVLFGGGNQ